MQNIILSNTNPFDNPEDSSEEIIDLEIHIRVYQRSPRRYITTVEGLDKINLDLKKIIKYMKKTFSCGAAIIEDKDKNKIIKLQGDQRGNIKTFLINEQIVDKDHITVHGY